MLLTFSGFLLLHPEKRIRTDIMVRERIFRNNLSGDFSQKRVKMTGMVFIGNP